MGVGDLLRKIFSPANGAPPDAPRLSGASESALGSSLRSLPAGERGWITFAEAARLFSSEHLNTRSARWMTRASFGSTSSQRSIAARRSSCRRKGGCISHGIRKRSARGVFADHSAFLI